MVVEDDQHIADLVELYLRQEGFRVVQAADGRRGLEAVRDQRPRMVILDVGLPTVDGLEVCRRLRADSDVPILMLTARDGEIDRVLGLEMGADDYVSKPFSPVSWWPGCGPSCAGRRGEVLAVRVAGRAYCWRGTSRSTSGGGTPGWTGRWWRSPPASSTSCGT